MRFALSFDDVLLVPKEFDGNSRSEIDISTSVCGLKLDIPIISANMPSVTEIDMAVAMAEVGGLGIIHRMCSESVQCGMIHQAKKLLDRSELHSDEKPKNHYVGAAVGVDKDAIKRAKKLISNGANIICVDVAHGHQDKVFDFVEEFDCEFTDFPLIFGNLATFSGVQDVHQSPNAAYKIGVGSGCFIPGSEVRTSSGIRKIEDITVGDRVFSHTGQLREVINTLAYQRDEEILSVNNKIECTKNHEFYVVEKSNEALVNEYNLHDFAKWIPAEDLDPEKHLLVELQ